MKIISLLNKQLVSHCTISNNKHTRGSSESHFKPFNLTVQHSRPSHNVFKVPSLAELGERLWLSILSYPDWLRCHSISGGRFAQQQLEEFELSCQKPCLSTTASPRTWQLLHTRTAHTPLPANSDHHRPPVGSRVALSAYTFGNISAIMFYYLIWRDSL